MGPIEGWGNVWGTSVTVTVTISTSLEYAVTRSATNQSCSYLFLKYFM